MIYKCLCIIWYSLSPPDVHCYQLANYISSFVEGCFLNSIGLKFKNSPPRLSYSVGWQPTSIVLP